MGEAKLLIFERSRRSHSTRSTTNHTRSLKTTEKKRALVTRAEEQGSTISLYKRTVIFHMDILLNRLFNRKYCSVKYFLWILFIFKKFN